MGHTYDEVMDAIKRIGEHLNWKFNECDFCEDGSVWHGLCQIIEKD